LAYERVFSFVSKRNIFGSRGTEIESNEKDLVERRDHHQTSPHFEILNAFLPSSKTQTL
jgi:hypothetical protein